MRRNFLTLLSIAVLAVLALWGVRQQSLSAGALAVKAGHWSLAVKRLEVAAWLGDGDAQSLLGEIYAYGFGDVTRDIALASYWFRRCGGCDGTNIDEVTDSAAPHLLAVGKRYLNGGQGVERDEIEGMKWIRAAAAGGSKEANAMLSRTEAKVRAE